MQNRCLIAEITTSFHSISSFHNLAIHAHFIEWGYLGGMAEQANKFAIPPECRRVAATHLRAA